MGHHWHPGSEDLDTGIDGEIELVDPATDEVRNFRIGVQSKATEGIWRSENDDGFLYKARPEDIEYWMSSNQPVLLVCSRPRTDEAYFRNVQQWGEDPKVRATGLVDFNKRTDRFDASAASRLFATESRVPIVLEPPGPVPATETAKSNLLPIYWQTPSIWSVPAPGEIWSDWFTKALEVDEARTDVAMRDSRLWSLTPFSQAFLDAIGVQDAPEEVALDTYVESDDRDRLNLLVELVRSTLISTQHAQLRWCPPLRVAYFRLYDKQRERTFKWGRGPGRTVVKARESQNHEGLSGYRHEAAELGVRRLGDRHVLSVSPTYLFTFDGRQVSSFHPEALKKMKAMDRAAAVSQQLRMWESLLCEKGQLGADTGPFTLGRLLEVEVPASPPEQAWLEVPADMADEDVEIEQGEPDDVLTLFDEPEDTW